LISFPLGVGITLLSQNIILLIYGKQYENSIIALQILIWSGIFTFLYTAYAQLLLSIGKQTTLTKITGFCMILNVLLNLLLIPKFSYIGASFVTVVTEFTLLSFIFTIANNMGYVTFKQLKDTIKVIFASLIMGIFIFLFSELTLSILVPLSGIIYFGILFFIKTFDKEDLLLIKNFLKSFELKNK
jgi:O-antigen/teichoic acid export membrane protein